MKKSIILSIIFTILICLPEVYADDELQMILNDMKEPPAFKYIPKDKRGRVDWQLAVDKGVIKPLGKISKVERETPLLNLDIVFKGEKGTKHGVTFAHKTHTYYFNCDICHNDFTFKNKEENKNLTMAELKKGKFCGECHGKVAFSLNDCDRCHNKIDLPEEHLLSRR